MKTMIALAAAMTLAVPVAAKEAPAAKAGMATPPIPAFVLQETSIPFADRNGIRDFEPASDRVVFLQGRDRQWYRARTFAPCFGLQRAIAIGFETNRDGSFDRSSSLVVAGQRCQLDSMAKSDAPRKS